MQKKTCKILYDTKTGWFRCSFCGNWHYALHWIRTIKDKKEVLQCPLCKVFIYKEESNLELDYDEKLIE